MENKKQEELLIKKLRKKGIEKGDKIIGISKSGEEIEGIFSIHSLAGFCVLNKFNFPISIKDFKLKKEVRNSSHSMGILAIII